MHGRSARYTPALACILAPYLFGTGLVASFFCSSAKADGPAAAPYTVESAHYTATLREAQKKLDVAAEFTVHVPSDAHVFVPLLPGDAAVSDLRVQRGEAHPYRTPSAIGFSADKKGEYKLSFRFVLHVDQRGKTGRVVFPLAGAGQCWIELALPPGQKVETKPETAVQIAGGPTRVRVFPQAVDKIEIEWFPEEYAKEIPPLTRAQESSKIQIAPGLITRQVKFNLKVVRGRVDAFRIQLPPTANLSSFQCAEAREWRVDTTAQGKELTGIFTKPTMGDAKLEFALQEPFALGSTLVLSPASFVGAAQQQGRLEIEPAPEVTIREIGLTGARRTSRAEEIKTSEADTEGARNLLYEYDSLPAEVRLMAEAARPKLTASVESLAALERGVISLSSIIQYTIRDASVRAFKIKVPPDLSVMAVTAQQPPPEADAPRAQVDWTLVGAEGGDGAPRATGGVLLVRLRGAAKGACTLNVEAQQNLAKMNGIPLPRLETLDTESETGVLGVAVGPDVNLIPFSASKTRQIDLAQLPDWMLKRGAKLGYAYLEKDGSAAVSTIKVEPRLRAKAIDLALIGQDAVTRKVRYECDIEERPVFAFTLKVPPGVDITDVRGPQVRDWSLDAVPGILTVNLISEVTGHCAFDIMAETHFSAPAANVSLRAFDLHGADKVEGWLAIAPRGDVDLKATSTTGLTSVPISDVPRTGDEALSALLGYKFGRAGWSLSLDVLPLSPELDATLLSLLRFRPGLLSAVAEVQCNIKKAGLNLFEVELPKGALNSTIEADGVRATDFKNGVWRVELMNKVKGEYVFTVTYDISLGGLAGSLAYTGARLRNARNQTGFDIVCQEKSDAEIVVGEVVGAGVVDESELPREFAGRVTIPIVRTYRWSVPDRRIHFKVTGHLAGKTLQATVPACQIRTLLKREGRAINYLTCSLSNTNKQFLKVDLGPQSNLWGAYVDGRPVTASCAPDGATLVPILAKAKRGLMEIALIWSVPYPAMGMGGRMDVTAPRMDVQVQALSWRVFVPGEYQLLGAGGNMEMQPIRARVAGLPTILAARLQWALSVIWATLYSVLMPLLAGVILIGLVLAAVFLRRIWRTVWVTLLIIGGILVLAFFILPSIGHYRAAGPAMRRRILLEAEFAGKRAVPQAPAPVAAIKTEGSLLHVAKDAEIGMKQKAMGKEVAAEQIPRFEDVMKESLQEAADKKGAAAVQMLRKRVLTEEKRAMPAQVLAEAQASAAQPAPAPGAPLTAATRRAGEISVVGGKAFVRAPQKPQRGAQPVALTAPATVAPIAALDKLAHMQQEAAAPQLVVNLVGGRAKGALPIEISFPTAGTVSYEFRMPFAGTTQGTIRLTCIRAGAALCLQGIIGIAVLGIGLGFGWRRTKHAALVSALCVILFGLLRYMASPASAEYLRTAHWAVILVFVVLLVKLLAARVLRPATLAP